MRGAGACVVLRPGSCRAVKRVAVSKRETGREVVLVEAVECVGKGRGAGSGQVSELEAKVCGVGTRRDDDNCLLLGVCMLCWSAESGTRALAKKSLTDFVW